MRTSGTTPVTPRRFRRARVALVTALVLGVAGCSDGGTPDAASTSGSASASGAVGPTSPGPERTSPGPERGTGTDAPADPATPAEATEAAEPSGPEAESAEPGKDGRQTAVFGRVSGTSDGSCVAVGDHRDLRSGDVVGGPFDEARKAWGTTRADLDPESVRLYWVPMHTAEMAGVTVVAQHEESGEKVTASRDSFGDAEQWKYYVTDLELPEAGEWRISVTAGKDRGCFRMTLH
ncbi:hypothetical protein JQN72_00445 [Phycicoccus sp. CSK15P-2]|uniref:hypothetical protein n=1 Tax=Phycicoccus sp. CSK15P-2 TaxID=2807627 RepID=UPI0019516591|nr:hypothetical protein [Phycicoccus sp. CSK15P-2]MBM6402713.1 hypothetical protein [Phycicoccus sp. CSK15P-2]